MVFWAFSVRSSRNPQTEKKPNHFQMGENKKHTGSHGHSRRVLNSDSHSKCFQSITFSDKVLISWGWVAWFPCRFPHVGGDSVQAHSLPTLLCKAGNELESAVWPIIGSSVRVWSSLLVLVIDMFSPPATVPGAHLSSQLISDVFCISNSLRNSCYLVDSALRVND